MIHFRSTEAGLRLLAPTLRTALRTARAAPFLGGRIVHSALGSTSPRDLALQTSFLRLVSITEATIDSLAIEITEQSVPQIDDVIRLLMLEKELASTSTWDSRRRLFKRHHGVDLEKCAESKRLDGAIAVRNAIAHGLGRLTTKQALSKQTDTNLKRIDVTLLNGFIDLEPRHLIDCRAYLTDFLVDVDTKVGTQVP